jgi:hypothetical protein
VTLVTTGVFAAGEKTTSTLPVDEVDLEVATFEQAAFQIVYLVPKRQSYEEAFQVMESLTSMRPQVVQQLLEGCTSVKTKRLFMHAADESESFDGSNLSTAESRTRSSGGQGNRPRDAQI